MYICFFVFLAKICDMCHINATCINNRCVCNAGFIGNGFQCDGKQSIIHSVKSTFFQGNTVDSKNGPLLWRQIRLRNFVSVTVRWRCRLLTNFNVLRSKINWSYLSNSWQDLIVHPYSCYWLIYYLPFIKQLISWFLIYFMSSVFTHFRNRRPM